MKKFFLSLALLAASATAGFAQEKGKIELGAVASFGTAMSNFGIGGKARYGITDNIRLDGSVSFFLPKNIVSVGDYKLDQSLMDMSINAHYLFKIADKFTIYPLAGLGYYHYKIKSSGKYYSELADLVGGSIKSYKDSDTSGHIGINLGGGVSYQLNQSMSVGGEVKFAIVNGFNTTILGANLMFAL